jgi:hypothetical protein
VRLGAGGTFALQAQADVRGRGARSDASLRPATAAMGAGKSRAAGATPRVRARWGLPPGSAPLPSTAQTRTLAGRRRDAGRRARVLLVGKRVQAVPDLQQQGAARAPFPQLLPWSVALPLLRALPRRPHCGFAGRREVRALQGYGAPRRLARTWLPDLGRAAALRTAGRSGATRACCCSMYAWAWRALLLRTGPADFAEKLAQFCVSGAALGVAGLAPPPLGPHGAERALPRAWVDRHQGVARDFVFMRDCTLHERDVAGFMRGLQRASRKALRKVCGGKMECMGLWQIDSRVFS